METGAEAVEGSLWERRGGIDGDRKRGKRLRTGQCWGIHEWSSHAGLTQKKKKKQQVGNELYSQVSGGSTELWFESRTPHLTISAFSIFSPLPPHSSVRSFQWDSGKAMSNAPDVMRYNRRTGDFSDPLCIQPPWCIDYLKCLKVIYISSSVIVMRYRSIRWGLNAQHLGNIHIVRSSQRVNWPFSTAVIWINNQKSKTFVVFSC